MAQTMTPVRSAGTGPLGKPRSLAAVIVLYIVTLGIYGFYWQYRMFKELRDHTGRGIGGILGLVFAIFIAFVNPFIMSHEVGRMYEASGEPAPMSWVTGFWIVLPIVGVIIWWVKTQLALNRYWEARGALAG